MKNLREYSNLRHAFKYPVKGKYLKTILSVPVPTFGENLVLLDVVGTI